MLRSVVIGTFAAALLAAVGGAAATGPGTIVFSADRAPLVSGEVYRLGGSRIDLSRSPFADQHPVVAPRGGRVAFLSNRSGRVALYSVGLDGAGLRRLPVAVAANAYDVSYAWSPDGRSLAVVSAGGGTLGAGPLAVVRDGRATSLGRTDGRPTLLGWTPDGRAVSWVGGSSLHIVDARTGRVLADPPLDHATTGWTPQGLFAGSDFAGRVVVYDTSGRLVRRFAGTNPAFSFDGTLLASLHGKRLELRDARGAVARSVAIPHGDRYVNTLFWTGARTLFVSTGGGDWDVDAATGRVRRDDGPFPNVVFANGVAAWTSPAGASFAVHVRGRDGRVRTVGTVPSCTDDGAVIPAIESLQATADARSVVYASSCGEPLANLYAIADGGGVGRVTEAKAEQTEPELSPDGTKLAYVQAPATGLSCKGCPSSLWVAAANGHGARRLTSPPDCAFDTDPSWSPDGTTLVYSHSSCSTAWDLLTIPAGGGTPTDLHVRGARPAWGPARIAYVDPGTAPTSVWTMLPDGTGRTRVGATTGGCGPAWSADGRLAFCTSGTAVRIVDGTSSTTVRLPFAQVASLAWSPDGTRFAVAAKPRGGPTLDVFTVGVDGTHVQRATQNLDALSVGWR